MNYYPVYIPTLNRYEHLKRCVESLASNLHADKTELVIGIDYPPSPKYEEGYNRIKEYVKGIKGFGKLTVFEHDHNLGPSENWYYCERYCLDNYDACIGSEDDNEFSPCFLDFMNKALMKYENDESIESISGWSPDYFSKQQEYGCYLYFASNAWGVGRWKSKEIDILNKINGNDFVINSLKKWSLAKEMLLECPKRLNNELDMINENADWGDVKRGCYLQVNHMCQLRPCLSLVRNHGNDGTGLHCKKDDSFARQAISSAKEFNIECKVAEVNSKLVNGHRFLNLPQNIILKIGFYLVIIVKYVMFRIKIILGLLK